MCIIIIIRIYVRISSLRYRFDVTTLENSSSNIMQIDRSKKPLITIDITSVRNSISPAKYEIKKEDSLECD